jgi:hypothetical protein
MEILSVERFQTFSSTMKSLKLKRDENPTKDAISNRATR